MKAFELHHGDSLEVLAAMPENSVDAIVTDPPYGLEFMGKEWDSFRVDPRVSRWSAEKSGGASARIDALEDKEGKAHGRVSYHKRRTTSTCRTCGKRDAFRNPHACGEAADWTTIPVDRVPMEARAFQAWTELWGLEAYRVLKPGGHVLAFGGTRTHHRMIAGLEDAGFDIRDCLAWLYGSGFPKSLDISKAIDRAAGASREVLEERRGPVPGDHGGGGHYGHGEDRSVTAPATEEAARWSGWGTALKPAWEAIVLARKPIEERSIAANVVKHGTGALNVDGCRIPASGRPGVEVTGEKWPGTSFACSGSRRTEPTDLGRWPANVALDEEAAAMLDEQSGVLDPATSRTDTDSGNEFYSRAGSAGTVYPDLGGASRFFYVAKADSSERNAGLEGLAARVVNEACPPGAPGSGSPRAGAGRNGARRNHHPTVKPVALMAWLVRLVTPPGGVVLDPFMGSGSTGIAATRLGFRFIGIEREAEYLAIARRRIEEDAPLFQRDEEAAARELAEQLGMDV